MAQSSTNRAFILAIALSAVLVAGNGLISYRALQRVLTAEGQVRRSSDALIDAERMLSSLRDAETGQRGYLLTGQESYLEPYHNSLSHVREDFDALIRSAGNQEAVASLRPHLDAKLAELQRTIDLRRTQGLRAALAVVATGEGKREMDTMRSILDAIQREERSRYAQHSRQAERHVKIANATFMAANTFIIVLVGMFIWLLRGQARQLEQRVAERTASLEEANHDLQTFAYSVSHDLRAPLRSMQGFSRALLEDHSDNLNAEGLEFLQHINESGERMSSLVHDLLTYSRVGSREIASEPIQLQLAVAEALRQFRQENPKAPEIKVDLPHGLPSVLGHYTTLHYVLLNLFSNAQKFVKSGETPRTAVMAAARGSYVRLMVTDNGIGIPAEFQQRIFEVFERLHSTNDYPGTGLGLAIVRRGVERMKGRFGVESQPGKGSTFWIELPSAGADVTPARGSN